MPNDDQDIHARVAVLEVQMDNMKDSFESTTTQLKDIYNTVSHIKSKTDYQNGAIPHMQANLKTLTDKIDTVINSIFQNELADTKEKTEIKTKVGIFWGAMGVVITALISIIIRLI